MEEDRTLVGRLDFKSSEGRTTSLVGSTPTLFRQIFILSITKLKLLIISLDTPGPSHAGSFTVQL